MTTTKKDETKIEPIPVRPGDMIIADIGKTKSRFLRQLIRADKVSDTMIEGVYLGDAIEMQTIVARENVLANIGPKPPGGMVYGLSVSALQEVKESEGKAIVSRTDMPPGMYEGIERCLKQYERIFKLLEFSLEVHPEYGKRLGSYQTMIRKGTDIMRIHTTAWMLGELDETMLHEAGHGIWNRLLSHDLRAQLIKHYADSVRITPTELSDIQAAAHAFDNHDGSINSFAKTLHKKQDKAVFKKMIRWIKEVHKISPDDVEKLRMGGLKVGQYFPDHKIVMSSIEAVITQYGTKNAVEFFCEGFAYHFVGKPMPEAVKKTMIEVEASIVKEK